MKKSEFNRAMSSLYAAFAEIDEVKTALKTNDIVSIYRLSEGSDEKYVTVTNKKQINDNFIKSLGFDSVYDVEIKLLFHLNRKTKCATILDYYNPVEVDYDYKYCRYNNYIDSIIYGEMYRSEDCFGSLCPDNWEEIAEALRVEVGKRADNYILEHGDILYADSIEFDEICRNVWEDYCEGRIPDFPESIFDE